MKRSQDFVLTDQRMVTCTYHFNPSAAISSYGWRFQARHYCAYANGLSCLIRLRGPSFTLQLKILHPCLSLYETITRMRCNKYYANSDPFITYTIFIILHYLMSSKKYKETKSFRKTDRLI